MAAADLTVQRLRLSAPRAAPGLLPSVEDALRVSSKPAALLNRFVLVRRLRLRAAAGASAQTLALQLERAWQQLASQAQPMELAGDAAQAVWAPSLRVARQMLLKRWLRGEATEAWYWKQIAPPQVEEETWPARAVALMLTADEEAAVAVTAFSTQRQAAQARSLLALIAHHRMAAPFIEAIDEAQALAVLKVVDAADAPPGLVHRPPHAAVSDARPMTARARLTQVIKTLSPGTESPTVERRAIDCGALTLELIESPGLIEGASEPARDLPRSTEVPGAQAITSRALAASALDADLHHGLASPWSGLWLLLPLLLRHGLDDADDPLAAWAGALRAACQRLRVPDDDALHAAIADLELPPAHAVQWLRTARLAAIEDARLPLLRIARRRGSAWVSPERIDIEFPAASLDLRIRRAGFDINPGFVPWLGRIVHFHYPS